jgi:hypothetical protein
MSVSVLLQDRVFSVPKFALVQTCDKFLQSPCAQPYHIRSSVSSSALTTFLTGLTGSPFAITNENAADLSRLCDEFGCQGLAAKVSVFDASPERRIFLLERELAVHKAEIQELREMLSSIAALPDALEHLRTELSAQIDSRASPLQAEVAQLKSELGTAVRERRSSLSDRPPVIRDRIPPPQPVLGTRLAGEFRVRHIASGRFLAASGSPRGVLTYVMEFGPQGDVFKAEGGDDWTRVIGKDGLVWFVASGTSPSAFGLAERRSADKFCLFHFLDGFIGDRQVNDRVMTLGKDSVALFKMKAAELRQDQQFELVIVS